MSTSRASVAGLVVTGFAVLYAAASAATGWEPSLGWLAQAVIHLGELAVVVALVLSGVAGRSRAGRAGLASAAVGQATMAAAEVVWPGAPALGDVLFGVAPLLTGAGLVVAGVAAVRAGRLLGPARLLPLALGLATVFVLVPVMIGSGGPPSPVAVWTIAGWDALWFATAAAVLARSRQDALAGRPSYASVR